MMRNCEIKTFLLKYLPLQKFIRNQRVYLKMFWDMSISPNLKGKFMKALFSKKITLMTLE
jgi:hypothetical protein